MSLTLIFDWDLSSGLLFLENPYAAVDIWHPRFSTVAGSDFICPELSKLKGEVKGPSHTEFAISSAYTAKRVKNAFVSHLDSLALDSDTDPPDSVARLGPPELPQPPSAVPSEMFSSACNIHVNLTRAIVSQGLNFFHYPITKL